ncbi:MAG: Ig-like domain-containing protein, partial [Bacteroidota bacterium]|nr:Ig-like domain-containing protein [Bacteroidota bacterium]
MRNSIIKTAFILVFPILIFQCANRGTASGGPKDNTPPVVLSELPKNFSTNFSGNEIKIYFDEYIKLKNLQKQLIVSPPMDPPPEIMPLGSANKYISIKIYDTLQANTTYAFNFGNSIEDNNEGNPYPFYRYVFSTGSTIDSLSISGLVSDAFDFETPNSVSVMLYEVDSTFTDSIIFKQKPKYIGVTDSLSRFEIENLKAGKYLLTALKEESVNYTYQPKKDKFAYLSKFISVPSDTSYLLKLFEQAADFKFVRARQL